MKIEDLILIFSSIIWEAMPFIVLGVVLAGILEEFVPQQAITKVIPKNKFLAIAIGGLLGLVFPMCECGIVVVMKRLLRKGLPLGVCVSYLLAGPIVNVVVMLSTYVAFNTSVNGDNSTVIFGGPLNVVLLRCGLGFLVAFNVGILVDRMEARYGLANLVAPSVLRGLNAKLEVIEESTGPKSWVGHLRNISETALYDFVDIMAFLILGAFLASAGRLWIQNSNIETWFQDSPALSIVIMMALAIAFCICSEADAFIAANFPLYWPPASKIAFLVLGPMFDFKLFLMYTRVFRQKLIYTIFAAVCVQVFVFAMALHYMLRSWPAISRPTVRPRRRSSTGPRHAAAERSDSRKEVILGASPSSRSRRQLLHRPALQGRHLRRVRVRLPGALLLADEDALLSAGQRVAQVLRAAERHRADGDGRDPRIHSLDREQAGEGPRPRSRRRRMLRARSRPRP